jgi:hypothetical protein
MWPTHRRPRHELNSVSPTEARNVLKSLSIVYALVLGRWAVEDVFNATAARMSAFSEFSLILSPSCKSMMRLGCQSHSPAADTSLDC